MKYQFLLSILFLFLSIPGYAVDKDYIEVSIVPRFPNGSFGCNEIQIKSVVLATSSGKLPHYKISTVLTKIDSLPFTISAFATDILPNSVILHAWVHPNGSKTIASYTIPDSTFGTQTLYSSNLASPMNTYLLRNLEPNMEYKFKVESSNTFGNSTSSWISFKTPPIPNTSPGPPIIYEAFTTEITSTSVKVHGWVHPNKSPTFATVLLDTLSVDEQNLGGGSLSVPLKEFTISKLQPNTEYKIKIIAYNSLGISSGKWVTFKTKSIPQKPILTDYKNRGSDSLDLLNLIRDSIYIIDTLQFAIDETPIKVRKYVKFDTSKQLRLFNKYYISYKKQLAKYNEIKYKIQADTLYSSVDFDLIKESARMIEKIKRVTPKMKQQGLTSSSHLCRNFSQSLKILTNSKRLINEIDFLSKWHHLHDNIKALYDFYYNQKIGLSVATFDNIAFFFPNPKLSTYIDQNRKYEFLEIEDKCNIGDGSRINIFTIYTDEHDQKKQKNNLTILYKYTLDFAKNKPTPFDKFSSPSCQRIMPGTYDFWVVDEFNNKEIISDIREIQIKRYENDEIRIIEIPVNKPK